MGGFVVFCSRCYTLYTYRRLEVVWVWTLAPNLPTYPKVQTLGYPQPNYIFRNLNSTRWIMDQKSDAWLPWQHEWYFCFLSEWGSGFWEVGFPGNRKLVVFPLTTIVPHKGVGNCQGIKRSEEYLCSQIRYVWYLNCVQTGKVRKFKVWDGEGCPGFGSWQKPSLSSSPAYQMQQTYTSSGKKTTPNAFICTAHQRISFRK